LNLRSVETQARRLPLDESFQLRDEAPLGALLVPRLPLLFF
jgi:hypothetical protein